MNPRPDFCPGCGAQVYPEEAHCPFCGRNLRSSPWLSFLMGVGGAGAMLVVGALVWWVIDGLPQGGGSATPAAQQQAALSGSVPTASPPPPTAQSPAAQAPAVQSPAAQSPAPAASAPAAQSAAAQAPAPSAAPSSAATAGAEPAGTKDTERFASSAPTGRAVASAAPTAGATQAPDAAANAVSEAQLPLPKVQGPTPEIVADAGARKDFAKSTQARFTENGLDLTVATSGEAETVLTINFNFPAKTAAELIVAGPFPRQCTERGFKQVVFADPSGVSWLYDLSTQKMTQR